MYKRTIKPNGTLISYPLIKIQQLLWVRMISENGKKNVNEHLELMSYKIVQPFFFCFFGLKIDRTASSNT